MILKYLRKIFTHKWYVILGGLKVGKIPLRLLLFHDWSKFSVSEFMSYVRYDFTGNSNTELVQRDFDLAWNNHQKRNKHHWQYWILINDEDGTYPLPMPEKYVREMVADWMGASKAYTGSWVMVDWMNKHMMSYCDHMHNETVSTLYEVLHELEYRDSGGDGWFYFGDDR